MNLAKCRGIVFTTVVIILFAATAVQAQTISYPVSARPISVSFDSTVLTVQVMGAAVRPVITITLATGVYYIPGSFTFISGSGTVSETGTASVPVFTITGATNTFTFTIKRRADCLARSFALAGGTFKDIVKVDGVTENAPLLNTYAIKYATLTITQPASITNIQLGSNITRTLSFRNTGQGCVDTVFFEIDYSTAGLSPNGNITVDGISFSPDALLSSGTKKLYKIVGTPTMAGGLCDSDPALSISQPVTITGCNQVPTSYKASWGTNAGQLCQSGTTTGNLTVLNTIPLLGAVVTANPAVIPFCAGKPYASFSAIVSNTGTGSATNIKFYIANFIGNGFQSLASMAIDSASILVNGLHPSGIFVSVSPSWRLVKSVGSPACITGQPAQCLITMPPGFTVPATGIFTVTWNMYNCSGGLCDDGFGGSNPGIKLEYDNECGTQHTIGTAQTKAYGLYNQITGQNIQLPTQVVSGDCFNYLVDFTSSLGPVTGTNSIYRYAELKLTLPTGMTIANLANDVKEVINNQVPHTGFPKQVGQDVFFRFYPNVNNQVKFRICTPAGGPPCGIVNLPLDISMVNDSTCTLANRITSRKCISKPIEVLCPGTICTLGGISPSTFSMYRSSYGLPDNNQDGKPDVGGTIDLNKIDRDRYRPGDTLHSDYRGGVLNQTSPALITSWNYILAEWTMDAGTWQAATAKVTLKRGGISYVASGIPLITLTANKSFRANWSGVSFTPAFPAGGYKAGDSVVVSADFIYLPPQVTSANKTTVSDVGFDVPAEVLLTQIVYAANSIPVTSVVNGTTGFTCTIIKYKGNIIGHQNITNLSGATGSSCINITTGFSSSTSLLGGTSQQQYFLNEYRPIVRTDSVIYLIPAGWEYVGPTASTYIYTVKSGVGATFSSILTPAVSGSSTIGYSLKYDINAAYNNLTFPFMGTEGLSFNEGMLFRPGCNTPDSVTITAKEYGHFTSYPNKTNPGSYLNTNTALKAITYSGSSKPGLVIANNTGVVEAATETNNFWDVQITGANFNPAKYVWLATEKMDNVIDVLRVEYPIGTILNPAASYGTGKNIYHIASTAVTGLINPNNVVVRVYFTKSGCGSDSIKVRTGWDCGTFALTADNGCSKDLFLNANSSLSEIQLLKVIEPLPNATVDICNEIDYRVKITSTQNGDLDNPVVKVNIPPGMELVNNSFTCEYPGATNPEIFTTSPTGNIYTLNLEDHSKIPVTGLNGLISATSNEDRVAYVSLKLRANSCLFVSGVSPSFQIFGDRPCNGPAIGNNLTVIGNPVLATAQQVAGPAFSGQLTISGSSRITCSSAVTITASITSSDGNTFTGDSAIYNLPAQLKYRAGSFSVSAGSISSSTLTDNQLIIRFPAKTGNAVTLKFDVIAANNGCTSVDYNVIGNLFRSSGYNCPLSFGSCMIAEIKDRDTATLQIIKPQLSTSNFLTSHVGAVGSVTVNYTVTINNTGNLDASAGSYLVKIFCGDNNTGKMVHSFYAGAVPVGIMTPATGSFTMNVPGDCNNSSQFFIQVQDTIDNAVKICLCASPAGSYSITVLATNLQSFTAFPQGNYVKFNWVLSDEKNMAYYQIEQSTNNLNFTPIGSITATNSRYYSIMYSSPAIGLNYYRLKMVDKDGKATLSEIRTVKFGKSSLVKIYPNPAENIINIVLKENMISKSLCISLIAVDGRSIKSKKLLSAMPLEKIDISDLVNGKYQLRIATDNEVINKIVEVIR
jgi:hypothetical protein